MPILVYHNVISGRFGIGKVGGSHIRGGDYVVHGSRWDSAIGGVRFKRNLPSQALNRVNLNPKPGRA